MSTLEDDVRHAQTGDRRAFGRLVERFQNLAVAYAMAWLSDAERARDAAQDSFIDAYLHLGALEDPAAFAAWLRTIVRKHCDRASRRKTLPELGPDETASSPEHAFFERRERDELRAAVERLPEHERIVVALHYLGDEPQKDVAEFLELPLSTVKKRLFSARRRLEARREEMEAFRPSRAKDFAARIQLFLAIRAGDADVVDALVAAHRELLTTEERWTSEQALADGLPIAAGNTPLALAALRGDERMVLLLLDRGAPPDGAHSQAGRTPLWIASQCGYVAVAARLIEAGADPNHVNAVGHAPLHVAALRRHDDVMRLLIERGADVELRSASGATASEYRAQRPLRARISRARIETGIGALDLFGPLFPGAVVRVRGAAGTGLVVLLAEIARRLGNAGLPSIWASTEPTAWQRGELRVAIRELGIADCARVAVGRELEELFERETAPFALFVFQQEANTVDVQAMLPRIRRGATIAFVVDAWPIATRLADRDGPELAPPFDALVCTSRAFAERGIYPAIDPERTRSLGVVESRHRGIADGVRALLGFADERAAAVRSALAQPFEIWQHENGRPGEFTPLDETIARFESLVR